MTGEGRGSEGHYKGWGRDDDKSHLAHVEITSVEGSVGIGYIGERKDRTEERKHRRRRRCGG
jgi:hypothetical protein